MKISKQLLLFPLLSFLSLVLLIISRMMIIWINPALFPASGNGEHLLLLLSGIRFDWISFSFITAPALLIYLIVILSKHSRFSVTLFLLFLIIPTIIAAIINIADAVYYPFTLSRSTVNIFEYINSNDGFSFVWIDFIIDYWYAWIALFVLCFSYAFIVWRLGKRLTYSSNHRTFVLPLVLWFLLIGIWTVGSRGGLQYKPLNIQSAAKFTRNSSIAATLNTPFTILKTIGADDLDFNTYFKDPQKLSTYFSATKHITPSRENTQKNVVMIILESFSKNHIAYYNPAIKKEGLTPFLDSLLEMSCTYEAIANGKQSIQALPAIVSSIPTLMSTPFTSSAYAMNQINSIASVLKPDGYTSSFYHGGINGTMNFDAFLAHAGFDEYYGMDEFVDKNSYDGKWGIWDEDFFQFAAQQYNQQQQPFFSVLFSLSSHHPYKVPEKYIDILPKGSNKIHQTIAYTDLALKKFFDQIDEMEWFQNTLFIITADHTSEAYKNDDLNEIAQFSIPLAFYDPGNKQLAEKKSQIAQQTDIFPSTIAYLGLDTSIIAYGNNLFDSLTNHFAVNYVNFLYNYYYKDRVIVFDGEEVVSIYNFQNDPKYKNNLLTENGNFHLQENHFKAILQDYKERLVSNKLTIEK